MASKPTVTMTFAGDSEDLERKFADVGSAADNLEGEFNETERSAEDLQAAFREVGSAADEADGGGVANLNTGMVNAAAAGAIAEQSFRGVGDIMTFMDDQFGIPVGGLGELSSSLAGAAGGVTSLAGVAPQLVGSIGAMQKAVRAFSLTMLTPPAGIVIIIAAVVAGLVLLMTQSETARRIVGAAFEGIQEVAEKVFTSTLDAIMGAYNWVKDNWPLIATIISGPFAPLVFLATDAFGVRSALTGAITGAKDEVGDRIDDVVTFFTEMPGRITSGMGDLGRLLFDAGVDVVQGLIDGLESMFDKIPNPLDAIPGGGAISGAVGGIGGAIGGVFHEGGVVPGPANREMLAVLRGGETVLPTMPGQSATGGNSYRITVNALDPRSAADSVVRAIDEWERRNGRRFAHA